MTEQGYTDAEFDFTVLKENVKDVGSVSISPQYAMHFERKAVPHMITIKCLAKGLTPNYTEVYLFDFLIVYTILDKEKLTFSEGFSFFRNAHYMCVDYINKAIKPFYSATVQPIFDRELLIAFEENRAKLS